MAIEAEALRALEETKVSAWRPMKDAPTGVPIVAKHKPNKAMPHGWIATILLGRDDEDELDIILHYNGDVSRYGFHGCWDGWMTCEEAGSLIHRSALAEDTARAAEGEVIATGWLTHMGREDDEERGPVVRFVLDASREHALKFAHIWNGATYEIRALPLDKDATDANR